MNLEKLNDKLKNGKWLVLYYSEHCGYCTEFMPIWDKFVKKKTSYKKIKIDSKYADYININPGLYGVPTIHFYNKGKLYKKGQFNEDRTIEGLNKFIKKNLSRKTKNKKKTKKLKK